MYVVGHVECGYTSSKHSISTTIGREAGRREEGGGGEFVLTGERGLVEVVLVLVAHSVGV